MTDGRALDTLAGGSPENDSWLHELVEHSPLIADAALRRHWQNVMPWLPTAARYELAAILVDIERRIECA